MKLNSLKDLFLCLVSDAYAIETQLIAHLPNVIKRVDSDSLKETLQSHLSETKTQAKRLEKIFRIMDEAPCTVEWSRDVKNIFSDMDRFLKSNPSSPLLDSAIIVFVQRVKHVEIATYGSLKEFADVLDNSEIKAIINETIKEEGKTDAALTKIATGGFFTCGVNVEATHNL